MSASHMITRTASYMIHSHWLALGSSEAFDLGKRGASVDRLALARTYYARTPYVVEGVRQER